MGLSDCAGGTTELGRRVAAIAPTVVLLRRELVAGYLHSLEPTTSGNRGKSR